MKKSIIFFIITIICSAAICEFFVSIEKYKFNKYFSYPKDNLFSFYTYEQSDKHKEFYKALELKKQKKDVLLYNICFFKDEILKQNKLKNAFVQSKLEKKFDTECEKQKYFLNNETYYMNLYNLCNTKKECKTQGILFGDYILFENKEAFKIENNILHPIDYNYFFKQHLDIDDPDKFLFVMTNNTGIGNQLAHHWGSYIYAQKKGLIHYPLHERAIHRIFRLKKPDPKLNQFNNIQAEFAYYKHEIDFSQNTNIFRQNPLSINNFRGWESYIQENTKFQNKLTGKSEKISQNMQQETSVSIHFRRGDFIKNKNSIVLDLSYYLKAIEWMKKHVSNPHFYVFSDDIKWVKKHFKPAINLTYVDWTKSAEEDLHLMTFCKNHIIANSSFSWWGAFLSPYKEKFVIIPPQGFYMRGFKHMKVDDNWIVIQ